jgi:hypothetical protein
MDFPARIPRALLFLLCCVNSAFAETPSDVHFTLAVTKSPAVYHLGERIVCKLSFSTTTPGKYGIDSAGPLKESRGSVPETFTAIPKGGTADPYVDLSRQLGFGYGGDLLSSYNKLSSQPYVVRTDLNQWLRFVKPGVYRLRAQSSRVSLFTDHPSPTGADAVVVTSNEVKVTVLPADPAWIANEVSDIKKLLDSPLSSADQKAIAASRLRYLNSESSTAEMVRMLSETVGEPYHSAFFEGLLESSWRKTAIEMLKQTIHGPTTRVSFDAVDLLTKLTLLVEYENRPIPLYDTKDPGQLKALRAAVQERQNRYATVMARYTTELKASLPRRAGRARTDAVFALWKEQELHSQGTPTELLTAMRREIVSVADGLTLDQQAWLLVIYWQRLPNRQGLLPLVKKLALSSQPIPVNWAGGDLRKTARACWCELDAAGCQDR